MIVAEGLSKRFGNRWAVRDVGFRAEPGRPIGVLGPNGAGKSTILRMLTGVLIPDEGRVSVCGRDTARDGRRARTCIGYLPEAAPVHPELTCEEYLRFRARIAGVARTSRRGFIDDTIDRCSLGPVRGRPIGQLSKGYRQRVALGGAIVHRPAVIILDEPTNALDPLQVAQTRRLVADLAREHTVVISTHLLHEAERTCGRLLIIAGGRLLADGTPEALAAPLTGACIVELRTSDRDRFDGLARRLGVSVEPDGAETARPEDDASGWLRRRVHGDEPPDLLRARLAEACCSESIPLRELRAVGAGLEETFAHLLRSARNHSEPEEHTP